MNNTAVDILPKWVFRARWTYEISVWEIGLIIKDLINNIIDSSNSVNYKDELLKYSEKRINDCFWPQNRLISIHQYSRFIKKFKRELFIKKFPELSNNIDDFCFYLKARVSLSMHPEKIEEVIEFMRENDVKIFKPWIFRTYWKSVLKVWFNTFCRWKNGEIDWKYIHSLINEKYPCSFSYMKVRPKFTKQFLLERSREILDKAIEERWYWYPSQDLGLLDKNVYISLCKLPEYRNEANRPDLESRGIMDVNSRPNWFSIAKDLWKKYQDTMRIWRWEWIREIVYRNLDDAVEELIDTLDIIGVEKWSPWIIYNNNANLYAWFKNHHRKDDWSVDWDLIVSKLPQQISSNFSCVSIVNWM